MPPHSKTIYEEGAVFKSFKLIEEGVFQERGMTRSRQGKFSSHYVDFRPKCLTISKSIHLSWQSFLLPFGSYVIPLRVVYTCQQKRLTT